MKRYSNYYYTSFYIFKPWCRADNILFTLSWDALCSFKTKVSINYQPIWYDILSVVCSAGFLSTLVDSTIYIVYVFSCIKVENKIGDNIEIQSSAQWIIFAMDYPHNKHDTSTKIVSVKNSLSLCLLFSCTFCTTFRVHGSCKQNDLVNTLLA